MDQLPIALGLMTAGEIRLETHESICAVLSTNTITQHYVIQNGPYLDNGRNELVRTFNVPEIRKHCTHLLMVDSDIAFTPAHVRALYEAAQERAVVGGVYYNNFSGLPKPVVYDWTTNANDQKTLGVIDSWEDGWEFWPTDDPGGRTAEIKGLDPCVRVEAIGAGFLMIRYEVIDVFAELFEEPQVWFDEPVVDGIHFGEDLAFCQRVKNSGFSVWAHREVEVAHIKPIMLGPKPIYEVQP